MKSCEEFSNAFDILYNNITSNQAPGLNEYEKSVFLTKAQKDLIKARFDASVSNNSVERGFDDGAIRQMDFSNIVKAEEISASTEAPKTDPRAIVYTMPDDTFIIINEQMYLKDSTDGIVKSIRQLIPLSYQEYMRLMSKPFKEPLKWQAWKLMVNNSNNNVEVILSSYDKKEYAVRDYNIRYVKMPVPVILSDLTEFGDGIKIDGKTEQSMCELNESTHEAILERAVTLAKLAWGIGLQTESSGNSQQ